MTKPKPTNTTTRRHLLTVAAGGAAYSHARDMGQPIERIRNFTAALARLAPTIEDGGAAAIMQELTLAIQESLDEVDESYGYFFQLHHPDHDRFEREVWPDQVAEARS
jgi:hypothetical protein